MAEGLFVSAFQGAAWLCCAAQRLDGQATPEGLWVTSRVKDDADRAFRISAVAVGRARAGGANLSRAGKLVMVNDVVRCIRPGLTEEYTVSALGVRQDFVLDARPTGNGEVHLDLDIAGATAEPCGNRVSLALNGSRRKVCYHRLRAVDASDRELPARFVVNRATRLSIVVDDAEALYPVRIDPTFSDADWVSLGGIAGPNPRVSTTVVDDGGKLYIGGFFRTVGSVIANGVAMWDGNQWSAFGSGVREYEGVTVLAVAGTNVYAGGGFTAISGTAATNIARWDGQAWSSLGSGLDDEAEALVVWGTNLYAGGWFTMAGETPANRIARWDGSRWWPVGEGFNGPVETLVTFGTNLYAGGGFTTAGGVAATNIARWDGSRWWPVGLGLNGTVWALVVSGTNLYAGGGFNTAVANGVAKWDGSSWQAVGGGVPANLGAVVYALAILGTNLYAGGWFTTAGGTAAANIAQWDGNVWSNLGSGVNNRVLALASDAAGHVFVGGWFTVAGTNASPGIAQANVGFGAAGGRFDTLRYSPLDGFSFTFRDATPGLGYRIQSSASLLPGAWIDFTNFTYTGPIVMSDTSNVTASKKFYRATTP